MNSIKEKVQNAAVVLKEGIVEGINQLKEVKAALGHNYDISEASSSMPPLCDSECS